MVLIFVLSFSQTRRCTYNFRTTSNGHQVLLLMHSHLVFSLNNVKNMQKIILTSFLRRIPSNMKINLHVQLIIHKTCILQRRSQSDATIASKYPSFQKKNNFKVTNPTEHFETRIHYQIILLSLYLCMSTVTRIHTTSTHSRT